MSGVDPNHFKYLFPVARLRGPAFTTRKGDESQGSNIVRVGLDDKVLGLVKPTKGTSHPLVDAPLLPNGEKAWKAFFPKGSINPSSAIKGGFGFYLGGPPSFSWESANEILFSYAVFFEEGFNFQLGGKLPGPYGGATTEEAYGASGGRKEGRDTCFSLRLMWRAEGKGELYTYLPIVQANDEILSRVQPHSIRNPDYGFSVGRGAWTFGVGEWNVMAIRVKLNDHDKENGEIEVFHNGKSVISTTGIVIRQRKETVFRGAHFQTFFGGSSLPYACPKDQSAYFTSISGAVVG